MGVQDDRPRRDIARDLCDTERKTGDTAQGLHQEDAKSASVRADFSQEEIGEYRPTPLKELVAKLRQNPEFCEAYENTPLEFTLMLEISAARARSGLTQAEIAARMGTTQSAVARLETERLPSMRTLKRYAEAVGAKLVVKLEAGK